MSDPITVLSYDPVWPENLRQLGAQRRAALGGVALRIDHLGSTASRVWPPSPSWTSRSRWSGSNRSSCSGRHWRRPGSCTGPPTPSAPSGYFREPPGQRRTHIHVRRAGGFSEQVALLFRDFLRADPAAAQDYGRRKLVLAARFAHDRHGYLEAKTPSIWDVLRRADQWAQATGWEPGPSDA